MSLFLPISNKGTMAIAICDRCGVKHYLNDLSADGNSPGLRVCHDCWDTRDPWRLPPRKTEKIDVKFPRPDTDIGIDT